MECIGERGKEIKLEKKKRKDADRDSRHFAPVPYF